MIDIVSHNGVFDTWDVSGLHPDELRYILKKYQKDPIELGKWLGLRNHVRVQNALMATQKLIMANSVYPSIDRLVITNQTTTPDDSETSYSGTIYTTVEADEYSRSGSINPYQVGWNIISSSANGQWGSLILITSTGTMINRALANITKTAGTAKLVLFTGSVV